MTGKGIGPYGENLASAFLVKKGYKILERNYRKRFGELDIIAEDGEDIVFVEVKTRKSTRFGNPFEAVDIRKQRKMSKVALSYLDSRKMNGRNARFDVVAIMISERKVMEIEVIKNAFELCLE